MDISVSPKVSLQACIVLKKSKILDRAHKHHPEFYFLSISSPLKIDDVLSASAIITVCCLSADALISLDNSSPSALNKLASFSLSSAYVDKHY